MEEHGKEQEATTTESPKSIFQDFTCRLCLFRDPENTSILVPEAIQTGLIQKLARHLCIEVKSDDEYPKWICKFCRRSLEAFDTFHNKVSQIQESLYSMLAIVRKTSYNVGETPRLDEVKLEILETTVGFRRRKNINARCKRNEPVQERKTRASNQKNKLKNLEEGRDETLTDPTENTNDSDAKTDDNIVSNQYDRKKILRNGSKDTQSDIVLESSQNIHLKDDDASSLEDQDWVGQDINFGSVDDPMESENDTWVPPSSKRARSCSQKLHSGKAVKRNLRKRKPPSNSDNDHKELPENDVMDKKLSDKDAKKTKLWISATHGTLPKPRVPAISRKMMRAEIQAMMVQFYGITCDICVEKNRNSASPIQLVKYKTFEDLCAHMHNEHNDRGYVKCCNCTMREKKRAEKHMLLHTKPGYLYKCNICGKQLGSQHSFRCHILLHLPDSERPYHCNQCDRGFVTKTGLTHHEQQHLPEDKRSSFTCDICGSRFGNETGLMMHKQRVHEKFRPHLCDLCAKSFNSRSDMERHKAQIHSNVKREQCEECGKWFKGKSILKTHMRQHRGASYECQYCDKKYSVRSSWRAHLLRHSNDKPHKCPHCEKSFKLPGTLKMHLNQHTGDLPYSCPFCPKKFASSGNYYTHRRRKHSDEVAQMKEAQEVALTATGLPPASAVPPPNITKSFSEAILDSKKKVAAKAKSGNGALNIPNPKPVTVSKIAGATSVVPKMSPVLSPSKVVNPSSVTVSPVTLTYARGNSKLLMTPIGKITSTPISNTLPVPIRSVIPSLPFRVLPNESSPTKMVNKQVFTPSGLKVVNLIQPVAVPLRSEVKQEELIVSGTIAANQMPTSGMQSMQGVIDLPEEVEDLNNVLQ